MQVTQSRNYQTTTLNDLDLGVGVYSEIVILFYYFGI